MRQLSPATNLLLTLLAAAGVPLTLALPWYGVAPVAAEDAPGGVEAAGAAIARWFTSAGPTHSGAEALGTAETAILTLCGVTALLALAVLAPVLRRPLRGMLKTLPLAVPLVVVVHLFSQPAGEELRWGTFAALAASLLLFNSAFHGAEIRAPKPAPKPYAPAGSVPPPGR